MPKDPIIARRNRDLILVRKRRPEMTLQQLGHLFGLTRERVRQLLKREGQTTKHKGWGSSTGSCSKCGKKIHLPRKSRLCAGCLYTKVVLTCAGCSKPFERLKGQVNSNRSRAKSDLVFCDRLCRAYYFSPKEALK